MSNSSVATVRGAESRQQDYAMKRAAWKLSYVPALQAERGTQIHKPLLQTDVTAFEKEFVRITGGVPGYKAFPKEEAVLRHPRTGMPCPEWAF